jgi:biotin synthase-related radical SAM superfamily protein
VFDISKVGHRTTSTTQVNGFGWLTSSEIAINDLVSNQPLLASLQKNLTAKPEKKMLAQVIKTAATVNTVRKNAGPFLYGEPDDENGTTKRVAARCNQCMN